MKIVNLIKVEFIKNHSKKKWFVILLSLLISIIALTEISAMMSKPSSFNIKQAIEEYKQYLNYEDGSYKEEAVQEFEAFKRENKLKVLEEFQDEKMFMYDWRYMLLEGIQDIQAENFVIGQMIEHKDDSLFKKIGESEAYQFEHYEGLIRKYYGLSDAELEQSRKENEETISTYKTLIRENIYYQYLDYTIKQIPYFDVDGKYQILVDHKIKDERHFLSYNQKQLHYGFGINGYYGTPFAELSDEASLILKYSLSNYKKHDLSIPYDSSEGFSSYETSKTTVNKIVILSLVVLVLMIFTSGDFIIKEHEMQTEKLLLTTPNKRWKILLSKFLYLIIDMFLIWFVALILLILYAGIRYGFGDLFTSKLIVENGSVVEVNYFFYLLKEMLLCSIPMIAFLSILLMISVVTLKTVTTTGTTLILLLISPFLWFLIVTFKLTFLIYTPFPYFILGFALRNSSYYLFAQTMSYTSIGLGIIISVATIIVCYGISHFIYTRRDIKN